MWSVGPGHIGINNLMLLGLQQVTKAGMQPILRYVE